MAQRISPPSDIEIHLLGPFRVRIDGAAVEEQAWARRKPALLVKLLALEPHHQLHREQVMDFLWPDSDPEAAVNNLHKVIHQARRVLEPALQSAADSHFIFTQGQQVSLRAPGRLWVDVEEFERRAAAALRSAEVEPYTQALAVYEGELLVEDLYEDWAAPRREQLRAQRRQLLSNLAALHERRGEPQPGIELLKELLACDATDEEAHRRLMRLYALAGDRHQSLRQYQFCAEALRKELDVEPERATEELRRQIISGQLAPRAPSGEDERGAHESGAISSLAVLPLTNASTDASAEYLSDGITESIINNLSQLPQLKVMARSTVFRYKGQQVDPQEVGSRLGVRAVLTGRVLHRGDRLNIQTELVNVADGSQLWGEQYDRPASDIFEVQEEIAREITGKLRLRLSGEEQERLNKRYTANTEAYRLYLKGRHHWNKRTVEALWKGIESFRQAIQIEPAYALAYAGLSDCYAFLGDVGLTAITSREAFAKAKHAARQALELDDALAEAHLSLAHMNMHYFEWPEAERGFKRAVELNPNHPVAHQWYAHYLLFHGQGEEAIKESTHAQELDPLSLTAYGDAGQMLFYTGQYDAGIEQYHKALELEPNFYRIHLWLGWAYEQKRMYGEATANFQKARTLSEESTEVLAALGRVYALSGKTSEALAILAELHEARGRKYVSPYNMSLVHLSLGEKDRAFEWLDRAYREHAEWMIYLKVDPRFDDLRAEPRFKEILRRIGFAP